jgi:hypothetical protein
MVEARNNESHQISRDHSRSSDLMEILFWKIIFIRDRSEKFR